MFEVLAVDLTQRMAAPPVTDRRAARRHAGRSGLLCGVAGGLPGGIWAVQVHDVSTTGIGLLLHRRLEPGTVVNLQFARPVAGAVRPRSACVIHATRQVRGRFLVGCAFDSALTPEELAALVQCPGGKVLPSE